jgi:antitoxin component YwqK of YwqJK toxin-antitoxin module
LKDGLWEHWYLNGQQELMDAYLVKSEEKKTYLKEGSKKYAEFTKSNLVSVQEGPHFSWYENGQPKDEGAFKDNNQDGKWIYYYDDGKKMYEQTFVKGKQEGKVTSWYAIGTLESVKNYKNNRPNGKWVFYEKQAGKVKRVMNFKDGKKVQK